MKNIFLAIILILACPHPSFGEDTSSGQVRPEIKKVVFAGGCFWCMQPPYDALKGKGVISAIVGYAGGHTKNPTYKQTSAGDTGHLEVIQVAYDSTKISFKEILAVYWKNIDPYDAKGQFCDRGEQYSSAIFYSDESEKKEIDESVKNLKKAGIEIARIATRILPSKTFYKGEDYHQSYYVKNPVRYKLYRYRCGRDARLKEVWGSSSEHSVITGEKLEN